MAKLTSLWSGLGRPFSEEETAQLRKNVGEALAAGYQTSPFARLVVTYVAQPLPAGGIVCRVGLKVHTMAEHYANWVTTRRPPLFGELPDAKVLALAGALGDPATAPVLDLGAGPGRNAVALARRGHPTDAVEFVPEFAEQLRAAARAAKVEVQVIEADILSPELRLPREQYKLIVLSEVVTHLRDQREVRAVFQLCADRMAPGGLLVFNAFLPVGGYTPDVSVRQVAQTAWSCLFTRSELAFITGELPFDSVSDEPAQEFEKAHLPSEAWPQTSWYETWSQGQNVFDLASGQAPISLRWLVYQRH